MSYQSYQTIAAVGVLFSVSVPFLIRGVRLVKKLEVTFYFVHEMATNHLPHIYNSLARIERRIGIDMETTPVVGFIDLDKKP